MYTCLHTMTYFVLFFNLLLVVAIEGYAISKVQKTSGVYPVKPIITPIEDPLEYSQREPQRRPLNLSGRDKPNLDIPENQSNVEIADRPITILFKKVIKLWAKFLGWLQAAWQMMVAPFVAPLNARG